MTKRQDESMNDVTATQVDDHVIFADSISCISGLGRNDGETKVRVGGCTSSGMIVRALIRVLGKSRFSTA